MWLRDLVPAATNFANASAGFRVPGSCRRRRIEFRSFAWEFVTSINATRPGSIRPARTPSDQILIVFQMSVLLSPRPPLRPTWCLNCKSSLATAGVVGASWKATSSSFSMLTQTFGSSPFSRANSKAYLH